MKRSFKRTEQPYYISSLAEYQILGKELKNTTREKLAEKFGISHCGLSSIARMTVEDFSLIKALIEDRNKTIERRRMLRRAIYP